MFSGGSGYQLSPASRRAFTGLLLGMFVSSISQTIVGPAMPRIVAELGGMDHYSWVATSALLVSAVTVPIVGKLSDLYGRRRFYLLGLIIFMVGSVLSGASQSFGFLILSRSVQGLGMGFLIPLSQIIVGDLIPPRHRGKYQGFMGAIFGLTSIVGPVVGGAITDHFGWRWLFYITLPLGVAALLVISRFLPKDGPGRRVKIDFLGMVLIAASLTGLLLGISLGGTSYPWASPQIIGLFSFGLVTLLAFMFVESRAVEPVLPGRIFTDATVALCCLCALGVNMLMFGSTIYIPVFAQGALGVNATGSGTIMMPMSVAMIVTSIVIGLRISATGHYKTRTLIGVGLMGLGEYLLTQLDPTSPPWLLTAYMVVFGLGLGACMQVHLLLVQNVAARTDLGVVTAALQFFRNVGSTVGIALFGTIMNARLAVTIPARLPEGAAEHLAGAGGDVASGGDGVGAIIDPAAMAGLPPEVVDAVRWGLSDAVVTVFWAAIPIAALVFLATALVPNRPLRDSHS